MVLVVVWVDHSEKICYFYFGFDTTAVEKIFDTEFDTVMSHGDSEAITLAVYMLPGCLSTGLSLRSCCDVMSEGPRSRAHPPSQENK
jgi:hypothetical protein